MTTSKSEIGWIYYVVMATGTTCAALLIYAGILVLARSDAYWDEKGECPLGYDGAKAKKTS